MPFKTPAKCKLLHLHSSQHHPLDGASGQPRRAVETHIHLVGNCNITRVWCVSHRASVCTGALAVKANSSPPFPRPMLSATSLPEPENTFLKGKFKRKDREFI